MTEAELQRQIVEAAGYLGWTQVYHTRFSLGSDRGFPDLILVKPGRLVAIECKGPRGRVSPEQEAWIETLATVPGVTALIAWPDRWDEVEEVLREEVG